MNRQQSAVFPLLLLAALGWIVLPRPAQTRPQEEPKDQTARPQSKTSDPAAGPLRRLLASLASPGTEPPTDSLQPLDDFLKTGPGTHPFKRTHYEIECLIATVPDPADSRFGHRFDLVYDAIQLAIESRGFIPDRYDLPWLESQARKDEVASALRDAFGVSPPKHPWRDRPGVVVFRHTEQPRLIVLFLVGETSTLGIQKVAFTKSLALCRELDCGYGSERPFLVLGPYYSGAALSLRMAIDAWSRDRANPTRFRVITGSARSVPEDFSKSVDGKPDIDFKATVHNQASLVDALRRYLDGRIQAHGWATRKVALLVEADTYFGSRTAQNSPNQVLLLRFPLHISDLRSVYDKGTQNESGKIPRLVTPVGRMPIPFEDTTDSNPVGLVPPLAVKMTAPTENLILSNILSTIVREEIRYVSIVSSDTRDKIFLIKLISEYCPDVQLSFAGSDFLLTHPEFSHDLSGALVASTYPLYSPSQKWCYPYAGARRRALFAMENDEGVYNATVALLGGISLLDYGFPDISGTPGIGPTTPPVWISVIGQHGPWPIHVESVKRKDDPMFEVEPRFGLKLMPPMNDLSGIPTEGKNLIVVADVKGELHFRIFDNFGDKVVDAEEGSLAKPPRADKVPKDLGELKKQLVTLWAPKPELTEWEKDRVITAVTSIVDHTGSVSRVNEEKEIERFISQPFKAIAPHFTSLWIGVFIGISLFYLMVSFSLLGTTRPGFVCRKCLGRLLPERLVRFFRPRSRRIIRFFRPRSEEHRAEQRCTVFFSLAVLATLYFFLVRPALIPFNIALRENNLAIWVVLVGGLLALFLLLVATQGVGALSGVSGAARGASGGTGAETARGMEPRPRKWWRFTLALIAVLLTVWFCLLIWKLSSSDWWSEIRNGFVIVVIPAIGLFTFLCLLVATAMGAHSLFLLPGAARGAARGRQSRARVGGPAALALIAVLLAGGLFSWLLSRPFFSAQWPEVDDYLTFDRTMNLGSGVSPVLPLALLGAAFCLWAYCQLKRLHFLVAFQFPIPFEKTTSDSFKGLEHLDKKLSKSLHRPLRELLFRPMTLVTLALFVFSLLWVASRLIPTVEGPWFDRFAVLLFFVLSVFLLFMLLHFLLLWSRFRQLLHRLELLPMSGAYSRLPSKVSLLYGRLLHTFDPRLPNLALLVQQRDAVFRYYASHQDAIGETLTRLGVFSPTKRDADLTKVIHEGDLRPIFDQEGDGDILTGSDLRLLSPLNDVSGIPAEGKDLIVVAAVKDVDHPEGVLHFRIFDGNRKTVVNTDEKQLIDKARDENKPTDKARIERLKSLLSNFWGVPRLTRSDKYRVITAVTSVVGHKYLTGGTISAWLHEDVTTCLKVLHRYWLTLSAVQGFPTVPTDDAGKAPPGAPAEVGAGLKPNDVTRCWLQLAEDFVALETVTYLSQFSLHLGNLVWFLTAGSLLQLLSVTVYPFQPQRLLALFLWIVAVGVYAILAFALIRMDQDEIISRVSKTQPNHITFDRSFLATALTYIIPLVGVLLTQFPGVTDFLNSILAPLYRILR